VRDSGVNGGHAHGTAPGKSGGVDNSGGVHTLPPGKVSGNWTTTDFGDVFDGP
jgi:hypothetical protein